MSKVEIHVERRGRGDDVLLVHGGASPTSTWAGLEPLADRWTLVLPYRRGFDPSPPGRADFEVDADDLAPLLDTRPHVVAHSYGALGALIAAARRPERVRSLTLVEPGLQHLLPDDPDAAHLDRLGTLVLRDGLDTEPSALREFLTITGAPVDDGPLPDAVLRAVRRGHGGRPTGEARPRLDVLRAAGIPSLVASGSHRQGIEHVCDALAVELAAQRVVAPGAGHFVAAADGFADRLARFLASVPEPNARQGSFIDR